MTNGLKIVRIDWIDAASEEGTLPLSVAKELLPYHNTTVGFLLSDNDDRIVLVQELCDPRDSTHPEVCRGASVIPKICIISMTYLVEASPNLT
jgi:hypothetical protein